MYWELIFDVMHKFKEIFVRIWKKYGTIFFSPFGSQRVSAHFLNIHLPGPIKRLKIAAVIRFDLDVSKMTRQVGCCTK